MLELMAHPLAWVSKLRLCPAADAFLPPKGKAGAFPALTPSEAACPDGSAQGITPLQALGWDSTTFCSTSESDASMPVQDEKWALGLSVHSARNTLPDTEKALVFHCCCKCASDHKWPWLTLPCQSLKGRGRKQ